MALLTQLRGSPRSRTIRGRLRSGTSALVKKYHTNTDMLKRFNQLVEAEEDHPVIAVKMKAEFGVGDAVRPVNTPYFIVKKKDFVVPGIAELILREYATLDEVLDRQAQLYRLPIVFDDDTLESVLDYRYQGYLSESKSSFWSEVPNQGERKCMTLPLISDTAKRVTGPRIPIINPLNQGQCDPVECYLYQARKCNLRGAMYFYIPKVPGISAIRLDTNSGIGGELLEAKLRDFVRAGFGLRGATFYLTKRLVLTKFLNPSSGQLEPTRVWVPDIEFPMDFTQSIRSTLVTSATQLPAEAQMLIGNETPPQAEHLTNGAMRVALFKSLPKKLGYKPEDLSEYGKRKLSPAWSTSPSHLAAMLEEIESMQHEGVDIQGFLEQALAVAG
jgi:hypothetical protein